MSRPGPATSPSSDPAQLQASLHYAGPLPPPSMLAQYNDALPDGADRIVQMLERQAAHRIEIERAAVRFGIWRGYLGIGSAFIIAIGSLAGSVYVVMSGHDTAGAVIFGATVISLVGTFVYGTNSQRDERIEKTKLMAQLEQGSRRQRD